MRKSRKANLTESEMIGFILGAAAFIVLALVFKGVVTDFITSSVEESGDSYFKTFEAELEKADDGNIGEFSMWQDIEDEDDSDVFLIYFSNKIKYIMKDEPTEEYEAIEEDKIFISTIGDNVICVCFWDGEDSVCKKENCKDLEYPINFGGDYGPWVVSSGDTITITKGKNEYFISKDGVYSGPVRLMDIEIDDEMRDNQGREYVVISSSRDGDYWTIELIDLNDGALEAIWDLATSELNKYDELYYEII